MSLELMDETIFSLLNRTDLNESQISYVVKEVLKGVEYLHSHHRLHRDIKSDNILFNYKGDIKISDFGFSTQITSDAVLKNTLIGTPSWMAPEIIDGEGYSSKVDVWAIGVLIFEMTEKSLPFRGSSSMEIICNARNLPCPKIGDCWSADLKDFAQLCFEKDPDTRASAGELMFHEFLKKGNREEFLKVGEKSGLC
jgi:serine/threonine protein kinase